MEIAIVKYNAGNIYSVVNALRRLQIEPLLTNNPDLLAKADKVIFPGQGNAAEAMAYLQELRLDQVIRDLRQPVLGICVGQQLLCRHSEEGDTDCLGIFNIDVKRFRPKRHEDKVPAIGWQEICTNDNIPLVSFIQKKVEKLASKFFKTSLTYEDGTHPCYRLDQWSMCQTNPRRL